MDFKYKLMAVRKDRGLSQEELAERIGVSRQAVSKWESGESLPDIDNLMALGDVLGVSIDRLLRDDKDGCASAIVEDAGSESLSAITFLCVAKKNGYAAHSEEQPPSRPSSHDLSYKEGKYLYIDTYLGGEKFSGEEALWYDDKPVWAMNYSERCWISGFLAGF